ncbi:hypothetical protein [Aureimonas sp. AU40]|uniref:hypothetical protein n=1 Tax=Aureimonas sp. AU40 TaxID=1637747 RepID=UPI000AB60ABA|nr:hypothetical protein [Aureimonas sp. AU40]
MNEIVKATEALVAALYSANHPKAAAVFEEVRETLLAMLDTLVEEGLLEEVPEPVAA